ncbi:hypothetical protein DL95DRAFT_398805 [Leptodontidium sp. 2 PMI_412]|nr:hypothetical protein DL95DRAFT_398805 [Leptodontidium sp. 2 PMI_412]
MVAPEIFYRVEDKGSRAQYVYGEGIFAEDTNTRVHLSGSSRELRSEVENHINWRSRIPTIFISTYSTKEVALREARRRIRDGKEKVVVYQIDIREKDRPVEFREMRRLASRLGVEIPDCAWNNSKYEYIFQCHVPESAVVDCWKIE